MGEWSIAPLFLTSALDGGEWSATCPCCFTPGGSPQYPLDRRLSGPQNQSGHCGEEISCTAGNWTQTIQPTAHCYTDSHPDMTGQYVNTAARFGSPFSGSCKAPPSHTDVTPQHRQPRILHFLAECHKGFVHILQRQASFQLQFLQRHSRLWLGSSQVLDWSFLTDWKFWNVSRSAQFHCLSFPDSHSITGVQTIIK
jgi:hypothetical protein